MNDSPDKSTDPTPDRPVSDRAASEGASVESEWQAMEDELSRPPTMKSSQAAGRDTIARPHLDDPTRPIVLVETAFLASAASLLWLVTFYFPNPVLRVFFPIPIALIYQRWGNRAAWMGALSTGLLLSVLMGLPRSILYVMPFGVMGVLLGMLWRRRAGWGVAIAIGGLLGAIGFFFRIWLTSLMLGDDLWLYATTQVTEMLDWLSVKLGLFIEPSLSVVQALVVVMVLINNFVYLFVVHLAAWFLFDRLGNPIPRPPKWVQVLMDYE